jgi:heme exporter protein D
MSYQGYVVAAYLVFAVVLLWDWVAPRIQLSQQLRAARLRASRAASPNGTDTALTASGETVQGPLSRE